MVVTEAVKRKIEYLIVPKTTGIARFYRMNTRNYWDSQVPGTHLTTFLPAGKLSSFNI